MNNSINLTLHTVCVRKSVSVCVCVFLQTTAGCRFHKFIPVSIKHSTLKGFWVFCVVFFASDPISLFLLVCLLVSLSLSGILDPKLLSL